MTSKWEIIGAIVVILSALVHKIKTLEDKLDYMKAYHELDKRLSIVERKKNVTKGQSDLRILVIIILLVLLYLYLKSINVIS